MAAAPTNEPAAHSARIPGIRDGLRAIRCIVATSCGAILHTFEIHLTMERLLHRGVSSCPIARFPSTMLPSSVSQARRFHVPGPGRSNTGANAERTVEILEQEVQDLASLPARVAAVEWRFCNYATKCGEDFLPSGRKWPPCLRPCAARFAKATRRRAATCVSCTSKCCRGSPRSPSRAARKGGDSQIVDISSQPPIG